MADEEELPPRGEQTPQPSPQFRTTLPFEQIDEGPLGRTARSGTPLPLRVEAAAVASGESRLSAEALVVSPPTASTPAFDVVEPAPRRKSIPLIVRNRKEALRYSLLLIDVLQEALDYDPLRQNNQVRPDLRINDEPAFLQELHSLIAELRRLNDLLAAEIVSTRKAKKEVVHFAKHVNTFLDSYASALGKGAGCITIMGAAGLLYQTGIAKEFIDKIWAHAKLPGFPD